MPSDASTSTPGATARPVDDAPTLLALLERASTAYDRPDLARMVREMALSMQSTETAVAVVGTYQAGKSSLIDALLGAAATPVVAGRSTTVTVRVGYGPELRGTLPDGTVLDLTDPDAVAVWEAAIVSSAPLGDRATVEVPSPLLSEGLAFVDTPGAVGALGAALQSLVALPVVDAVLLVTSITQELTADEVALVAAVRSSGRPALVVAAKTDLQPAWRSLLERNRTHLGTAGLDVDVVGVSAPLRSMAMDRLDDELDEESGMPAVVDWLLDSVLASVNEHRHRSVVDTGRVVLDALEGRFRAEKAALEAAEHHADTDPPVEAAEVAELRRRAREMETGGSRWSAQLAALMDQAATDVDADLRRRGRAVIAESDARIDAGDPATDWPEVERWLEERVASSIGEHLSWCHQRLVEAVEQSTSSFGELVALVQPDAPPPITADVVRPGYQPTKSKVGASVYAALKNSYGGLAMVGFFGSMAGVVLTAPITLGIGLVLGGKQIRDERAKQLTQRRNQAKAVARSYVDQAWSTFGNASRAQFRGLQKTVRVELAQAVEQLYTDTRVALESAVAAAEADQATRRRRLDDVHAELRRLHAVRERVEAFAAAGPLAMDGGL